MLASYLLLDSPPAASEQSPPVGSSRTDVAEREGDDPDGHADHWEWRFAGSSRGVPDGSPTVTRDPGTPEAAPVFEAARLLTPQAFDFVLNNELKRALRAQNFLTLVVLQIELEERRADAERSHQAGSQERAGADEAYEVARILGGEVRETDLLSRTDQGVISLLLLDADLDSSLRVIDRLMSRLDQHRFPQPFSIAVGAAACPTDAVNAGELRVHARARHVARRRRSAVTQNDTV